MWRRYGDDLYAILVLAVFALEAFTLDVLTWRSVLDLAGHLETPRLAVLLVGGIAVTAVGLLSVGGYVLCYHVLSTRRERTRRQDIDTWSERWVGVLLRGERPPSGDLPPAAVESLLDLREVLEGTEGVRVESLMRRYWLAERLLDRSRRLAGKRPVPRILAPLRRHRLSTRLEALEALSKARLAYAVTDLLDLLEDREAVIRLMALRSVTRTIARMPEDERRAEAARRFADALIGVGVSSGAVEEALLLLEGAAPLVLDRLLDDDVPARLRAKAIDAVGRLKLLELADRISYHAADPDPEPRASVFRALARIGILPPAAQGPVRASLEDPVAFVRIQATRAAVLLPPDLATPALWRLLGDESWWVRRAAAESLLQRGGEGLETLERAVASHPDRYGRHMSVQILLDAGRIDAAEARRMREAV